MRLQSIDVFRGFTILLMVLYSLMMLLCENPPYLLNHNRFDMFHPGDLVLPMFLFASGMSLVFFAKKRSSVPRSDYVVDIAKKVGKLILVWIPISFFVTNQFLGMDEIMLNILLFVPSLVLLRYSDRVVTSTLVLILASHLLLQQLGFLPDFAGVYLGGFQGAVYYLPLMLAGILTARRLDQTKELLIIWLVASIVLLLFVPPHKLSLTPSYIVISIAFSLLFFELLKNVSSKHLVYLGRRPLRYWILMFFLFIIPIKVYGILTETWWPRTLSWELALVSSLLAMIVLYFASKAIDWYRAASSRLIERLEARQTSV